MKKLFKSLKFWYESLFCEGVLLTTHDNEVFYTSSLFSGGLLYNKRDFKILIWTHKPSIILYNEEQGAIVVDKNNWTEVYDRFKKNWLWF